MMVDEKADRIASPMLVSEHRTNQETLAELCDGPTVQQVRA